MGGVVSETLVCRKFACLSFTFSDQIQLITELVTKCSKLTHARPFDGCTFSSPMKKILNTDRRGSCKPRFCSEACKNHVSWVKKKNECFLLFNYFQTYHITSITLNWKSTHLHEEKSFEKPGYRLLRPPPPHITDCWLTKMTFAVRWSSLAFS